MPILSWFATVLTLLSLLLPPAVAPLGQAFQSPAAPGELAGLRIHTGERGIYRLTGAELRAAGVPLDTLDPSRVALWQGDEPVAIRLQGTEDGRLNDEDALIFYAVPYSGRYMTSNVYRLTWNGIAGARMTERSAAPSTLEVSVSTVQRTVHIENDVVYYSTYHLPRNEDHFFDETLFANAAAPVVAITRTFTATAPAEMPAQLVARLHGGNDAVNSGPDQAVAIRVNGGPFTTFTWKGSRIYTATLQIPPSVLQPGANTVTLQARLDQLPDLANFWVSPDWIQVTYPSAAEAVGDELYMPATSQEPVLQNGQRLYMPLVFSSLAAASPASVLRVRNLSSLPEVLDVTDPRSPVRLRDFVLPFWNSYSVVFAGSLEKRSYFVAATSGLRKPLALVPDLASDWRSPAHEADYIAIVHRSLWDAAQPLLDHRAAEGLRVAKVDVQDIYDEFSGGRVDPEAIRAFLAYAYGEWNGGGARPAYVVLIGDGHYDLRNAFRTNLPNLIPPYLLDIDPFIGETGADNRYASVDGDDDFVPEMSIGRIPAKTPAELTAYVNKVLAYELTAPSGEWQARAVFVADAANDSAGNFHQLSEESRVLMPGRYDARTIYFGATPASDSAAEMRTAMRAAFDAGALYFQWFGHASRQRWGGGLNNMFDLNDPPRLAPNVVIPFTAAYSCWSGYFLNARGSPQYGNSEQSLGEALVMAPGRGSLVDLSPTGLHVGSALVRLNQEVVKAVFQQRQDRVGLAVSQAKLAFFQSGAGFPDLLDTQVLLGDPAVKLRLPPQ